MSYLLSLTLFLVSFTIVAQSSQDYIVKKNNQKIFGSTEAIYLKPNDSYINFKPPHQSTIKYRPSELQEVKKGEYVYVSKQLPESSKENWVFLRRLTEKDAPVQLYEYVKNEGFAHSPHLFLEKENELTKVKPLQFRKQMQAYFKDQADVVDLIARREVKKRDLIEIVEEYNELVKEKGQLTNPVSYPFVINRQKSWDFNDLLLSPEEAAKKYKEAINAGGFASTTEQDIVVNYQLGISFFQQKKYREAIPYLKKARNIILEAQQQLEKVPIIESRLAQIYYTKGQYNLAIGFNSNALKNWQTVPFEEKDVVLLYETYLTQGMLFQYLDPLSTNPNWYKLSTTGEEKNWKVALKKKGLKMIHHTINSKKTIDYNLALLNFQTALELVDLLPADKIVSQKIDLQLALGLLYFQAGDYSRAENHYEKALQIIAHQYGKQHPKRTEIERRLSEIYLANELYNEALEYINKAQFSNIGDNVGINQELLKNINKIPFPYELLHSIATRGEILYKKNRTNPSESELKEILAHYDIATEMLYQLRNIYRMDGNKSKLGNITHKISQHAVIVCNTLFNKTGTPFFLEKAFSYAELSKSAVLFEAVQDLKSMQVAGISEKQIMLENGLKAQIAYLKAEVFYELQQGTKADKKRIKTLKEYISITIEKHKKLLEEFEEKYPAYYNLKYSSRTVPLSRLQDSLSSDEVFLEYVVTDSFIYTLAISNNAIKSQFKPLTYKLSFVVQTLQHALRDNKPSLYSKYGYLLYRDLLKDLESFIEGKKLIIVPDAELNYIPFGVLPTQANTSNSQSASVYANTKFLIQTHSICYNYSAGMFLHSKQQKENNAPRKISTWAPDFHTMESIINEKGIGQQLNALPGAKQEAQHIADMFGSTTYLAERASELQFKKEATQYGVLHIATHGVVNDLDPLFSSLILRNEGGEDGILHAYELYNMELQANLAVLSACNSGIGTLKKGEGVVSIARGFSYAGVPNIVMSKWPVSDWSTETLMKDFYKNLKRGLPKDEALRQAKINYLKNNRNTPELLAPFYWGGFVLSGNTDPLVTLTDTSWPIGWFLAIGFIVCALLGAAFLNYRKT